MTGYPDYMLSPGDLIKCNDKRDLKKMLKALNDEGYGAVVTDYTGRWIRITSAPEQTENEEE